MRSRIQQFTLALAGALLLVPFAEGAISTAQKKQGLTNLEQEVRHELVMLPYLGVFDNLEFQVKDRTVILTGHVTRPTLQKAAERVVTGIEGIENVINNIEVLPLSPFDDRIRLAAYSQIYGFGPLQRYNWGPVPPIHIIVKNGHITLTGVVANETDSNMANLRANGVSGAFSVTNQLQVENRG